MSLLTLVPSIAPRTLATARMPGGHMPSIWLMSYAPPSYTLTRQDLSGPEWTYGLITYCAEIRHIMSEVLANLERLGCAEDILAVAFAIVQAMNDESTNYHDPDLKRLGNLAAELYHWLPQTKAALSVAETLGGGAQLAVLRERMACLNDELRAAEYLVFCPGSVGWLSALERDRSVNRLEEMLARTTRHEMQELWGKYGGTPEEWKKAWRRFQRAGRTAIKRLMSKPVPTTPHVLGRSAIDAYLKGLWIDNTPEQCLALIREREAVLVAEIQRLRQFPVRPDDPIVPSSNAEAQALIERYALAFHDRFVATGVLPAEWDPRQVKLVIRKPGNTSPTRAVTSSEGTFVSVMSYEGRESDWEAQIAAQLRMIIWHELIHAGQSRHPYYSGGLSGLLAQEGGAMLMQWVCATSASPAEAVAILTMEYEITFWTRAVFEFHLGLSNDIEGYVDTFVRVTGLSQEMALRVIDRMLLGPAYLGKYLFGSLFVERFVRARHGRDVTAALSDLACRTGLVISPHVFVDPVRPSGYRLPIASTPLVVEITRALHPSC